MMKKHPWLVWLLAVFSALGTLAQSADDAEKRDVEVLVVAGASGADEYVKVFDAQVRLWQEAGEKAGATVNVIGRDERQDDASALEDALKKASGKEQGLFWLVLIGHGTFDGREPRLNLRGPDPTARQLGEWLKPVKREMVIIQGTSAAAGFLPFLGGKNRTVVTATKSADEVFYARFGEHFAPAIAGGTEADLNQDRQVSVLEAFLFASRKTAEFYEKAERLATEHALLDDNGDGKGTRAEEFVENKPPDVQADGNRAGQLVLVLSEEERKLTETQRQNRDALERKLEELKSQRAALGEEAYYRDLEKLLRQLGQVYSP